MAKQSLNEFDVFYISFDEPNAEKNYADLVNKIPWAQRTHGVKGFDSAHKACAKASKTDRFITIDGDNIVDEKFWDQTLDIDPELHEKAIWSWSSANIINGLVYGNGGIKLWPKAPTLVMKTHENAEAETSAIDFCWDLDYKQMNDIYSTNYPNGSPYQAFRAGFREGVKMSLAEGNKVKPEPGAFEKAIWHKNYTRLLIWCCVGADVENGNWAMYGTRLGCKLTNLDTTFDIHNVRDYEWFQKYFNEEIEPNITEDNINEKIIEIGNILRNDIGIQLGEIDANASKFFKRVYINPPRVEGLIVR
jgi:hypothetical protein